MPIYEFYCPDCHTLFSFLSRVPDVDKRPDCPRCKRPKIERRASSFAVSSRRGADSGDPEAGPAPDEARLERAVSEMARGVEGLGDDDPRRMAGMMRKLLGDTGLRFGPSMEQALARLEAGEDPERIDEGLDQDPAEQPEEPWLETAGGPPPGRPRRPAPERVDDRLYEL